MQEGQLAFRSKKYDENPEIIKMKAHRETVKSEEAKLEEMKVSRNIARDEKYDLAIKNNEVKKDLNRCAREEKKIGDKLTMALNKRNRIQDDPR